MPARTSPSIVLMDIGVEEGLGEEPGGLASITGAGTDDPTRSSTVGLNDGMTGGAIGGPTSGATGKGDGGAEGGDVSMANSKNDVK
jgi:hypothetical protein